MQRGYIKPLDQCSLADVSTVGGKCAGLGELERAGLPGSPGFAVTVKAYRDFVVRTGIEERIREVLQKALDASANNGGVQFHELEAAIDEVFQGVQLTEDARASIVDSYRALCDRCGGGDVLVAVRSSATSEDSDQSSFAGQHETFLNVCGEDEVVEKTMACWKSLFSAAALHYRTSADIDHLEAEMAVAVQKMVDAKVSGVMFTANPITNDLGQMIIEMAWGLGEGVVGGYVAPDNYVVDKETLTIADRMISPKMVEFVRDVESGGTIMRDVQEERQSIPCMTDDEVIDLARMGVAIETYYGKPMDIEWAVDAQLPWPEALVTLQSRPITTLR
ncbi:MAG: hypothetical protein MUQ56_06015 [Thermoleophilia bacterium]|nr:hypothetical protein [Thermoleophilia bacterium]